MIRAKRATRAGWGVLAAAALIGCQGEPEAKKPPQPSFNPQALAVEARAQDIAAGIERYKIDVGQYPETLDDLAQSDAKGWKGPYLGSGPPATPTGQTHDAQSLLTDIWGQPFEYVHDADSPQVVSSGPDQQRGTPDDILVSVAPMAATAPAEAPAPAEPQPQ
ncbi:MAG: type II secretion system protein GspG [Pirellulaceae bacterium]|jgi:hypothetical protein|nr:type II secretion system protein GspG [Pirellulaceae bacterium]